MARVLLVSKGSYDEAPVICVRVVSYDAASDEMLVEGVHGHRWTMTKAYAKANYNRVQEIVNAKPAGVQT